MARLLAAVAADSTSAADRFGDRLVTLGLWLLGCLAAGAAVVGRGARQYCSPRDYHDAYPHSLLGGWTPCATSLLLTGDAPAVSCGGQPNLADCTEACASARSTLITSTSIRAPSFLAIVAIVALLKRGRKLKEKADAGGAHPAGSQHSTVSSCWHRWTVVLAFLAFAALRATNVWKQVDNDHRNFQIWELADQLLFIWVWELLILELFQQQTLRYSQEQSVGKQSYGCQLYHLRTPLMAALAIADIIKTMLTARPPWQPVTEANKMMPTMGGLYAGTLVLEAYMLMGIACETRLANAASSAAEGSAANMKEPLLADDGTAAIHDAAAGDIEAADDVPAET